MRRVIFEIPVYDQPQREYEERRNKDRDERVSALLEMGHDRTYAESVVRKYFQDNWDSWRFNRVVGWLVLCVDGSNIKAYLYWTTKQIGRRYKRQLHRVEGGGSHRFELPVPEDETNEDIRLAMSGKLDALAQDAKFKGCYIDRAAFDHVSKHLDWRRLIGFGWSEKRH